MTAQSRFRIAAAVAALIAPLGLVAATVAPADAAVKKHKHDVTIYKVEKFVKLKGVATHTPGSSTFDGSLSCTAPTDHALDGMWLVQSVDRYEPPYVDPNDPDDDPEIPPISDPPPAPGEFNDLRDVFTWWSYPETGAGNGAKWAFKLQNFAQGDAQVKLWITCVKGSTSATNVHAHKIQVSDGVMAPGPNTVNGRGSYEWQWGCPTNDSYFVAPGFKITNMVRSRLVASYPKRVGGLEKWVWDFYGPGGSTMNYYGKCIYRETSAELGNPNTHRHAIRMQHMPSYTGTHYDYSPGEHPERVRYTCDEDNPDFHGFKAAVGWFWMEHHEHFWFIGMEPQPKTREFSFWNTHHADPQHVAIGAFCINSRTGNPTAP